MSLILANYSLPAMAPGLAPMIPQMASMPIVSLPSMPVASVPSMPGVSVASLPQIPMLQPAQRPIQLSPNGVHAGKLKKNIEIHCSLPIIPL